MTDQTNAAKAAEQPLPSYGKLPFDQLGRDVTEATMGVREPFDFGPNYPGHAMCLINFNSLARIVDKYRLPEASAPAAGEAVRNAALEEAAVVTENSYGYAYVPQRIRALKTQTDKDDGRRPQEMCNEP